MNSLRQLATGKRINQASDDAAGLAIAVHLATQMTGTNQGIRNLSDGTSMNEVADGALSSMTGLMQRGRELSIQAANGTLSSSNRAAIQGEINQLQSEMARVANTASFNGLSLFDGSAQFDIQAGPNAGEIVTNQIDGMSSVLDTVASISVTTQAQAGSAIALFDSALESINDQRARVGAQQNRIASAIDVQSGVMINLAEAKSRIMDMDYAKAMSNHHKSSLLVEANQMSLLKALKVMEQYKFNQ